MNLGIIFEDKNWGFITENLLGVHPKIIDSIEVAHINNQKVLCAFASTSPHVAMVLEEFSSSNVQRAVRIGTCGGLQPDINVGDIVIASGAVRGEGTSHCYVDAAYPAVASILDFRVLSANLRKISAVHTGLIWCTDGRYVESDEELIKQQKQNVLAVDMETSAMYVVSSLKKIEALSISLVTDLPYRDIGKPRKGTKGSISMFDLLRSIEGILKVVLDVFTSKVD